jgi:hypothetical protein
MGIWTWLDRYEARCIDAASARFGAHAAVSRLCDEWREAHGHVSGIDTHRCWHAIHVALTGEEEGGTSPGAYEVSFTSAFFVHHPSIVRAVATYLRSVDNATAISNLRAAIERGLYVDSFDGWGLAGDQDIVRCGLFESTLDVVRRFYFEAADSGDVVVLRRG